MNRLFRTVLILLITAALAGCLLLTSIQLAAFDISFYERAYDKYNLHKTTELTKWDYVNLSRNILVYLNGQSDYLYNRAIIHGSGKYLFNQKELLHMEDVKILFVQGYRIRNLSFLSLIILILITVSISKKGKRHVGISLLSGSVILFMTAVVFVLLLNSDFYQHFTSFHHVFFTNDLWLLNPQTDLLINMYPLEFFNDMAIKIIMYFAVQLAAAASLGYFIAKKEKGIPQ